MRQIVDMGENVAVVPMGGGGTGNMSVFCRSVMAVERMRQVGNLIIPDGGQDFVMRPETR